VNAVGTSLSFGENNWTAHMHFYSNADSFPVIVVELFKVASDGTTTLLASSGGINIPYNQWWEGETSP